MGADIWGDANLTVYENSSCIHITQGVIYNQKKGGSTMNTNSHIYQVVRHIEDFEEVIFESANYEEAEYQYEFACHFANDFTYAWYELR
jgi:hypothetical protein